MMFGMEHLNISAEIGHVAHILKGENTLRQVNKNILQLVDNKMHS
jgi:hypothetical protein